MKKFVIFWLELGAAFLYKWPRKWYRRLGFILGWLWIDVFKIRKDVIQRNLDLAFPDVPMEKKYPWGRNSVYSMGANLLDVLIIPLITPEWSKKNLVIDGEENLQKAESLGKGVLGLSLHLGNGDLGASTLAMAGHKTIIISKSFRNPTANAIWYHFRNGQGVKFIEAHSDKTAFEILRALKSKAYVIFVLDQFMGRPYGIETTFFGHKTGTAYGLALFYLKTRSPVVPVYTFEGEDGKFHVACEPALELESLIGSDQDKTIKDLTQKFNEVLEAAIKKHPKDWMWVHKRWKEYE